MADAEKQEELKNLGKSTKRQSKWTYLTLDQVSELSPSVKDGLEKTKEAHWRRSYLHVIQEAGMRLRMCVGGGAAQGVVSHASVSGAEGSAYCVGGCTYLTCASIGLQTPVGHRVSSAAMPQVLLQEVNEEE